VKGPLTELLKRNNLTSPDQFSLQLLGGGSRVPRVQAELEGVLPGLTLEKQLDADEAGALGGGLVAANMSTTFRLRPFGMHDGNVFPVSVALHSGPGIPEEQRVRPGCSAQSLGDLCLQPTQFSLSRVSTRLR